MLKLLTTASAAAAALLVNGCYVAPLKTDYSTSLDAFLACTKNAETEMQTPHMREMMAGKTLLQVACLEEPAKDGRARVYVAQILYSRTTSTGEEVLGGHLIPPYGISFPRPSEE